MTTIKNLSASQIQKLTHMTGAGKEIPKRQRGYRNYFCSNNTGSDFDELQDMASKGYVTQGGTTEHYVYFHATEAGLKAIGFDSKKINKCLNDK